MKGRGRDNYKLNYTAPLGSFRGAMVTIRSLTPATGSSNLGADLGANLM